MKKTLALIISVILVVALFASCAPATEDTAAIDEENFVAGFYLENKMDQPLSVGSEVPKNSNLAYFTGNGKMAPWFNVHDSKQAIACSNWYGSGNTAYTVKDIDYGYGRYEYETTIYLTPKS